NGDDPLIATGAARRWEFSSRRRVEAGAYLEGGEIVLTPGERYPTDDLVIVGTHNLENAMAAYLAARLAGASPPAVRAPPRAFRPLPHPTELPPDPRGLPS